jgi:N-acetyl-anhydromuramyl-L-alanine amidase AmpD
MPAQIQPTRIDVTDRFPMLAFKVKADQNVSQAEIAIGVDPTLFTADGKKNRTAANFYSTHGNGGMKFDRGLAGYTVPPEVLARFIGNKKLYFGLATAESGGAMKVVVAPSATSPYINIDGLSGRSMARVRVLPSRQQRAAGYIANAKGQLEWAGDTAEPGMTKLGNGAAPAADASKIPVAAHYDDGFGPMPGEHQSPAPGTNPAAAPKAQSLAAPAPDYPRAVRFVESPAKNAGRNGTTIDRIVIHITDAPTTSSTVETFKAPGAQASAHYLVGPDGEVVQFVPEADISWHAGDRDMNRRSIGIEHVAVKRGGATYGKTHYPYQPPTDTEYCESAALVAYLCDKYGITPDRNSIIGHYEVKHDPNRKFDPDGAWNWDHYMDLVTNRYCAAQPAEEPAATQALDARTLNGSGQHRLAQAMVVGADDIAEVRKYAGPWVKVFQWSVPAKIRHAIEARGFKVQTLSDAVGDLNLDRFPVKITRFPSGWDAPRLLQHFLRNINNFINTTLCEFIPYDDVDTQKLASADPTGTVMKIDMFGPDNAAIVISAKTEHSYYFSTINTPWSGDHPVSGHRQFGYTVQKDGSTEFFTRGADRATLGFPGTEHIIFLGGEKTWEGFQDRMAAFINDQGGSATVVEPFSKRFDAEAVLRVYGHYETSGSASAQSLASPSFSVNWDDVELIPQPTNFSCWAASGAMLVGWRDQVSLTPDAVASTCSRSTAKGLLTDDNSKFAAEMGFIAVPPVCYTEDGFRALLEQNGPLWVSEGVPPNLHAIIVTGMYSDGDHTYVRIADPWDRAVGTPGKPGAYAPTHISGSRYIMTWDDFTTQYEAAMTGNPPNRQILHTGNPNRLTSNTGQTTPPPGYAQSYAPKAPQARKMPAARGLDASQSFTLNWDDVQQMAQPTNVSCWATSASMVLGWRDNMSLTVEGIAAKAGLTTATGLDPAHVGQFAQDMGMKAEPPQSYTADAFRQLLMSNGPLWVGAAVPGLHAIVVTGLYGDGTDIYVRITDPWDRDIGKPGAPGAYADTHATGSRYIMRWADFVAEYERAATNFNSVNLQILHCGGTFGHTANVGPDTPAGYAMAADAEISGGQYADSDVTLCPAPPPQARAMDVASLVATIGGIAPQILSDNSGDVSWELDQLRGIKHPGDKAPDKPAAFLDAPTIKLDDWPKLALYGIDDIYAWFTVGWQYNGKSLGNVRIGNIGTNDAKGMKLKVRAQIMDDNVLYAPGGIAALRIRLHYRFSRLVGDDILALTELQLFADGTHQRDSKWLQKSTI